MKTLQEIRKEVETVYATINDWNTDNNLLDMAYPQHDGVKDADAISEMMLLRQSLNRMIQACNIGVLHINGITE